MKIETQSNMLDLPRLMTALESLSCRRGKTRTINNGRREEIEELGSQEIYYLLKKEFSRELDKAKGSERKDQQKWKGNEDSHDAFRVAKVMKL